MLTTVFVLAPFALAVPCPPAQVPTVQDLASVVKATQPTHSAPTPPARSPTQSTPYSYQYNNGINPSGSCQNTSLSMLLRHYGVDVTPDAISSRYGTTLAQSPEGLAQVFNTYAEEAGIKQRLKAHRDGTMSDVDRLLDQDKPVIIHGYFTGYGHVLLTTGRTPGGYRVNDPAGQWSETFKGGYPGRTSTNGQGVVYSAAAFERAVGTSNGTTPLPIWYHEITENSDS